MLFDKIRYNWLITNVPHISFSSEYDWYRWLKTLTQYERMNFRMNISGIEQSKDMIEDDFDNFQPCSDEFEHLLVIHTRLIELLFELRQFKS